MVQLWVNLPSAHKMAAPRYQPIASEQMGVVELPGGAGLVRVVAGEYRGVRGPAKTFSPISVYDARLAAGGSVEFTFPSSETAALLIMKGEVTIGDSRTARANDFVLFRNEGERVALAATSDAHVLVLNGEPIREPIVQYGPFVMNTNREIQQAFVDYSRGRFGTLAD
jgi:redox-sensitive bicupin YhaK (pirin superfamily)